ncbi:FERM, RhoGEF and pleckstrin domain-containing protein 1 [Hypsibius exemplaris]|uniref:FERM, RhoGEF and pleckstrin domain-containing protein 1 n=1 Tax=Hypsibius exemplaris TaxID=2072580 RepID=A0A1W0X905_HYPEX|nr:FERM, RhoGEF and pleckstrin domain-containing protein 1 [Hypsibius exemplaris]
MDEILTVFRRMDRSTLLLPLSLSALALRFALHYFIKKTPIHNSNLNSPSDENRPPSLTTADHSPRPSNSNHHQFYSLSSRGGGSASIPRNAGRSSGAAVITTSGTTGRLTGKNVSNTGGSGAYNVSTQLEELTKKINGWKQQSQESFIKSFESKSLAGCESMRTLAEDSMDGRKRRNPADVAYFVAKEILNGERTYKTDLEVICVQLKRELDEAEEIPQGLFQNVFSLLQPIYESQGTLLVEIEHRLSTWESRTTNTHRPDDSQRIGDLLLKQNDALEQYQNYLIRLPEILAEFDIAFRKNKAFEQFYRGFEQYRYCYLPLTAFLLKPAQRLFQYQSSLERLLTHYPAHHSDTVNCESALQNFRRTFSTVHDAVSVAEHFTKLVDLQRDLLGIDNLAVPTREFIREGCLLKLSKKGYQLRMFVLLTDVLLYTNRVSNTTGQFKLHGQIGVRGMMVEDAEPREGMEHCFTLYGGNRALMLAANTAEEKTRWLHDLHTAVDQSKRLAYDKLLQFGSLKSYSSSDEVLDKFDAFHVSPAHTATSDADTLRTKSPSERSVVLPRSNTTLHVCWHRQTTISIRELSRAFQLQQSGYLLRKFKNSTGWQKLWVVFTDFCLFFFKNNQEDCPLASLPLIGYRVTVPSLDDAIEKDHVIKLYFTTHKYFLRTDSEFSFHRWMEVLGLATQPDHQNISPDLNGTGMHV